MTAVNVIDGVRQDAGWISLARYRFYPYSDIPVPHRSVQQSHFEVSEIPARLYQKFWGPPESTHPAPARAGAALKAVTRDLTLFGTARLVFAKILRKRILSPLHPYSWESRNSGTLDNVFYHGISRNPYWIQRKEQLRYTYFLISFVQCRRYSSLKRTIQDDMARGMWYEITDLIDMPLSIWHIKWKFTCVHTLIIHIYIIYIKKVVRCKIFVCMCPACK